MRKKIDAHVHIVPDRLLGTKDGFVEYCRCGRWMMGTMPYQAMPDIIGNSAFPASTIERVMENAGVESCVIMQGFTNALVPDAIGAIHAYPGKFHGAFRLDPARETLPEEIRLYHNMGLTVIKCLLTVLPGLHSIYQDYPLNSERVFSGWKVAEELKMAVAIDAGTPGNPGYDVEAIEEMAKAFPELHIIICHMGLPKPGLENDKNAYARWLRMCELGKLDNVWFECSALSTFYIAEAYPFPSAQKIVRDFMDTYGANKVMWASDMPGTLCDGTYRQLIDTYERSTLFTEEEKDLLFYDNAKAAYRI